MPFLIVNTIREYPVSKARRLMLNTDHIISADQQYSESLDETNVFMHDEDDGEMFPAVRFYLKYSLNVFPTISVHDDYPHENDSSYEQRPKERPSVIWCPGTLDDYLISIIGNGNPPSTKRRSMEIIVGETEYELGGIIFPAGASSAVINIPRIIPGETWVGVDGLETAITGVAAIETELNYTADDSAANTLVLTFDTGSPEGLAAGRRIHIHYSEYIVAP